MLKEKTKKGVVSKICNIVVGFVVVVVVVVNLDLKRCRCTVFIEALFSLKTHVVLASTHRILNHRNGMQEDLNII